MRPGFHPECGWTILDFFATGSHKVPLLKGGFRGIVCAVYCTRPSGRSDLVSEYSEHRAVGLLLGEQARVILVVRLVAVDDHVLGCGDQAVLDAAIAAEYKENAEDAE